MRHMRLRDIFIGGLALLAGVALPVAAQTSVAGQLPQRLIVRLKPATLPPNASAQDIQAQRREPLTRASVDALSTRAGTPLVWGRALADGSHVLLTPPRASAEQMRQWRDNLRSAPNVERVELDQVVQPHFVPSDPHYAADLWNLKPPLANAYGADFQTGWDLIRALPGVRIAVLDTGVLPHPDLVGPDGSVSPATGALAAPGYDFVGDCRRAATCPASTPDAEALRAPVASAFDHGDWISADDTSQAIFANCPVRNSSWHGTLVSGVAAALGDNGLGIAGAAFGAKILPVRVLGKCGGYISEIAEGMRWAAGVHPTLPNPTPARVLNLSLGALGLCSWTIQDAINAVTAAGAAVVVTAGNDAVPASGSMFPSCSKVITVGASGAAGDLAFYSNYGPAVTLLAPGGDSRSSAPGVITSLANGGATSANLGAWAYRLTQGTSAAAPHVAAAIALMLSRNPLLTPEQIKALLADPSSLTAFPAGSRCATQGDCGAGLLNAQRVSANAVSPLRASVSALDFGSLLGGLLGSREVTITNESTASVTVGSVAASGSGFGVSLDLCSGRNLALGQTCGITTTFLSLLDGFVSGVLRVPTQGGAEASVTTVALSAGVGSKLVSDQPTMDLASWPVLGTKTTPVLLRNRSSQSQRVASVSVSSDIAAISGDECSNAVLAAGASCALQVHITPLVAGPLSVLLSANTDGNGDVPYTVVMNAVATPAASSGGSGSDGGSSGAPVAETGGSGGGGCTLMRAGGKPDAALLLLVLLAWGVRRWRAGSKAG